MPEPAALLSERTTLRLGGPARTLIDCGDEQQLIDAVADADARGEPLLVLGGGSNIVVADDGFAGTVLAVSTRGMTVDTDTCSGATVEVAAGEVWDDLVVRAVTSGWTGIECMSGVPGRTGAAPIANVGAYGQEVSETIARVRAYDRRSGRVVTFAAAECGFGFRASRFKEQAPAYVVLSVSFQLPLGTMSGPIRYPELAQSLGVSLGERVPLAAARNAVLDLRRKKAMVLDPADHDTWSVGSFFLNPILDAGEYERLAERVVQRLGPETRPPAYSAGEGRTKTSAAWLIERAGIPRGYGTGRVSVSTRHTLALTHRGGGTTAELLELAREIRGRVEAEFGVHLGIEPSMVGVTL